MEREQNNAAGDRTAEGVAPAAFEPLAVTQVEAARRLTVTDRTIRNWERAGKITGKRVGGLKMYLYADLKRLVS